MEITIPEITFTIPNIDPTTAIIIIFVLLVFLVYWHYTLYPLLKKKRDHKRIRSATKSKTFKRKKSDFKPPLYRLCTSLLGRVKQKRTLIFLVSFFFSSLSCALRFPGKLLEKLDSKCDYHNCTYNT